MNATNDRCTPGDGTPSGSPYQQRVLPLSVRRWRAGRTPVDATARALDTAAPAWQRHSSGNPFEQMFHYGGVSRTYCSTFVGRFWKSGCTPIRRIDRTMFGPS